MNAVVILVMTSALAIPCVAQQQPTPAQPVAPPTHSISEYTHVGSKTFYHIDDPDTYTVHVEGVGDETCTFYEHDAYCHEGMPDDSPIHFNFYLLLDADKELKDQSPRDIRQLCGDATVTKIFKDDARWFPFITRFPYRLDGDRIYIPYHIVHGSTSDKDYLFISTGEAKIDGEACVELRTDNELDVPPPVVVHKERTVIGGK
jgi:hypothetical protein